MCDKVKSWRLRAMCMMKTLYRDATIDTKTLVGMLDRTW